MSTTTMNKGPEAIRICTAMTILCTIFVALRLWARRFKRMALAADDYMILVSLALVYGALAIIIISVQNGLGQRVVVVETTITNGLSNVLKGLMAVEIVYGTSLVTIKIGVLLMYYQIFPTRPLRISALVIGVVIMMWWIAILFVSIFQCTPVAYVWDKTIVGGKCINSNNFYIGNAVPNIITDLAILALPSREVLNLQMPRSQKAAIMGMFMMGGLVVIISIIRLASLFDLSAQGANADITYVLTLPWIYTTIEPTIGIISACLPTLRPLAYSCWGRTPQPSQKTPVNSNLVTIGGSGGGIPTWSMGGKVKGDDGTGSFERLNESSEGGNGSGEAGFTPKGYSSHRQNRISVRGENDEVGSLDEYPMHSIRVKKEVDWKEQRKI